MKTIFKVTVAALIIASGYKGYRTYENYQTDKKQKAYLDSLIDTSSPTVIVLEDSIMVNYRHEKKTIHLYVPPSYERDTNDRYPVMYFMDGESSFNDLQNMAPEWQIDEVIDAADEDDQPTAIVVGIEDAENRDAEYTPFVNEDNPDAHGSAYAVWVTTELKAWVDANYRTKSDAANTYIGGISRSGMMAYYMWMQHPDIFGNAIIQSPSMWVDHERLMRMMPPVDSLASRKAFISVGENEGGPMVPHAEEIFLKLQKSGMKAEQLKFQIIEDEGHWHPTWRKSFAIAYPWLMEY